MGSSGHLEAPCKQCGERGFLSVVWLCSSVGLQQSSGENSVPRIGKWQQSRSNGGVKHIHSAPTPNQWQVGKMRNDHVNYTWIRVCISLFWTSDLVRAISKRICWLSQRIRTVTVTFELFHFLIHHKVCKVGEAEPENLHDFDTKTHI